MNYYAIATDQQSSFFAREHTVGILVANSIKKAVTSASDPKVYASYGMTGSRKPGLRLSVYSRRNFSGDASVHIVPAPQISW